MIVKESRLSTASSEHAKKAGERSRGKSRNGDDQFYLVKEIDSKNIPINQNMARYAETLRDVLAWLCSKDAEFGYEYSSIIDKRKKHAEWRESSIINAKRPDDRRRKLNKLTEKPGKSNKVSFEEIEIGIAASVRYKRDAARKRRKAKKIESV